MTRKRTLRFEDLPLDVQRDLSRRKLEKIIDPNTVQEWLDQLERDAESYVKAVYQAFTGKRLSQKRYNATKVTDTRQPTTAKIVRKKTTATNVKRRGKGELRRHSISARGSTAPVASLGREGGTCQHE